VNPPGPARPALARRVLAEFTGTGLLVAVVVGSGIMAVRLSPGAIGLELLENSLATAAGLAVIIAVLAPVSGAHLNPVVSAADWALGRRSGAGLPGRDAAVYAAAQISGGIGGAVLAFTHVGQPGVGFGILGLKLNGFIELGYGCIVLVLGGERRAVVHVHLGKLRTGGAGPLVEIFHFRGSRLVRILRDVKKVHQAVQIIGIIF